MIYEAARSWIPFVTCCFTQTNCREKRVLVSFNLWNILYSYKLINFDVKKDLHSKNNDKSFIFSPSVVYFNLGPINISILSIVKHFLFQIIQILHMVTWSCNIHTPPGLSQIITESSGPVYTENTSLFINRHS